MTKEKIRKFLDNTKVYVNGKSREIQEKLFSFGYKWSYDNSTKVCDEEKPFLFIGEDGDITHSSNMSLFIQHVYREITAKEILALELTEPSYRPFKSQEECWQEMLKHHPFGWLTSKNSGAFAVIGVVQCIENNKVGITWATNESETYMQDNVFNSYTFADGTPFGIKED